MRRSRVAGRPGRRLTLWGKVFGYMGSAAFVLLVVLVAIGVIGASRPHLVTDVRMVPNNADESQTNDREGFHGFEQCAS